MYKNVFTGWPIEKFVVKPYSTMLSPLFFVFFFVGAEILYIEGHLMLRVVFAAC